ncbi:MAG: hypothetical protein AB1644_11435 [Candidatus Zixiibacteriota bacterium]
MRKQVYLLAAVILLYLIPAWVMDSVYGPSYGFLAGEDCWRPDGNGGWVQHGRPSGPMPAEPSVDVPLWARYLPIFLPGLALVLFLFTPLRKVMEPSLGRELPADADDNTPDE